MDWLELGWHLLNFMAPAWAVGAMLATAGLRRPRGLRLGFAAQWLLNTLAGCLALAAAVWWLERDGKMLGYAAMVGVIGLTQWLGGRQWR
jgi:hypothetical protein